MWAACPGSVVIVDRQVLAEALKENHSLKRLNLAHNKIGVRGVEAWCSDCVAEVCVMVEGVKQLLLLGIVDIMAISPRLHGQPNSVVQVFIFSAIDQTAGVLSFRG